MVAGSGPTVAAFLKSAHPESNQGPSDYCMRPQSDALPTDLAGVISCIAFNKFSRQETQPHTPSGSSAAGGA